MFWFLLLKHEQQHEILDVDFGNIITLQKSNNLNLFLILLKEITTRKFY